jgi:hypothetical protein
MKKSKANGEESKVIQSEELEFLNHFADQLDNKED